MKKYSIFGVELEFPYSFSLVASLSLGEAEQLLTDYLNDGDGGTINGVNAAVVSEEPLNASNDAEATSLVFSARAVGDLGPSERIEPRGVGMCRIVRFYVLVSFDELKTFEVLWASPRLTVSALDTAPEYDNLRVNITAKYRRQAFSISRLYSDYVSSFARDFISTVARMARTESNELLFDLKFTIAETTVAFYTGIDAQGLIHFLGMIENGALWRIYHEL